MVNPEKYIIDKLKAINHHIILAFISTIAFTLIVHGVGFVNKFVNEDSIIGIFIPLTNDYQLGRWFAPIVQSLTRGGYTVPWVIAVYSTIFLAFAVSFLVSVLEMKSKLFIVLSALLIVSFPSVARQFAYEFMAIAYTASLLLAVLAVYFTKTYKFGFIVGAFSLMLSLALYQSYIGFTIGVSIFILIQMLLREDVSIKKAATQSSKYIACGILGIIMYFISVEISLIIHDGILLDYRGLDNMGRIPLSDLPSLLRGSFNSFIDFFTMRSRFFYVNTVQSVAYMLLLLAAAYLLSYAIISKKMYREPIRVVLIVGLLLTMPIGLNIVDVITPQMRSGVLQVHQFVLVIILVFVICEAVEIESRAINLCRWVVLCMALITGANYMRDSGLYYFQLHVYYERTFAFYNRVLTRIEMVDGLERNMVIAPIGNLSIPITFQPSARQFDPIISDQGLWGQFVGVNQDHHYKMVMFISHYLGVQFLLASVEQTDLIRGNQEFRDMPVWPHMDSVAIIDGILVLKLNYDPPVMIEQVDGSKHKISNVVRQFSDEYYFAWGVYRYGDGRVFYAHYERGNDEIFFEFTHGGKYIVSMSMQDPQGEAFIPALQSRWFVFEGSEHD